MYWWKNTTHNIRYSVTRPILTSLSVWFWYNFFTAEFQILFLPHSSHPCNVTYRWQESNKMYLNFRDWNWCLWMIEVYVNINIFCLPAIDTFETQNVVVKTKELVNKFHDINANSTKLTILVSRRNNKTLNLLHSHLRFNDWWRKETWHLLFLKWSNWIVKWFTSKHTSLKTQWFLLKLDGFQREKESHLPHCIHLVIEISSQISFCCVFVETNSQLEQIQLNFTFILAWTYRFFIAFLDNTLVTSQPAIV